MLRSSSSAHIYIRQPPLSPCCASHACQRQRTRTKVRTRGALSAALSPPGAARKGALRAYYASMPLSHIQDAAAAMLPAAAYAGGACARSVLCVMLLYAASYGAKASNERQRASVGDGC